MTICRSSSWGFSFLNFWERPSSLQELLDDEQLSSAVEVFDLHPDEAPEAGFEPTFLCYSLLSPDK